MRQPNTHLVIIPTYTHGDEASQRFYNARERIREKKRGGEPFEHHIKSIDGSTCYQPLDLGEKEEIREQESFDKQNRNPQSSNTLRDAQFRCDTLVHNQKVSKIPYIYRRGFFPIKFANFQSLPGYFQTCHVVGQYYHLSITPYLKVW